MNSRTLPRMEVKKNEAHSSKTCGGDIHGRTRNLTRVGEGALTKSVMFANVSILIIKTSLIIRQCK